MLLYLAVKTYCWILSLILIPGESPMIPEEHSAAVVDHVCMVHRSVGDYSKLFLQKLRRCNYVTPKNYLDFISTYSNLLEEKDQYILGEKMEHVTSSVPLWKNLCTTLLCVYNFVMTFFF